MTIRLEKLDPKIPKWDQSRLIYRHCPSTDCGENNSGVFTRPDGLTVGICGKCGLIYVPDIPDREQLNEFYSVYWAKHKYKAFDADHAARIINNIRDLPWEYELIRQEIDTLLPPRRQGLRILEIGFGDGHFLRYMESTGADVLGLDLSREAVEFARTHLKLNVRVTEFLDVAEHGWDVIVMKDLLEHVAAPSTFLAHASSLLANAGLLVIWTPHGGRNIDEIIEDDAIVLRKDLEHLQYYNSQAVGYEALMNNFSIEHFETIGMPHFNWTEVPASTVKKWLRRVPYYNTLNRMRRKVMRVDERISPRDGRYNLFCILRKASPAN